MKLDDQALGAEADCQQGADPVLVDDPFDPLEASVWLASRGGFNAGWYGGVYGALNGVGYFVTYFFLLFAIRHQGIAPINVCRVIQVGMHNSQIGQFKNRFGTFNQRFNG